MIQNIARNLKFVRNVSFLLATIGVNAWAAKFPAVIDKVVDGDTMIVQRTDGRGDAPQVTVRLVQVDAPEIPQTDAEGAEDPERPGQGIFAEKAREFLEDNAGPGSDVIVEAMYKDTEGRTHAFVTLHDEDLGLKMIQNGWAVPAVYCADRHCTRNFFDTLRVPEYLGACNFAKDQSLGIFDAKEPLPMIPYEFRWAQEHRAPDNFVADVTTKYIYPPWEYARVPLCRRVFFKNQGDATMPTPLGLGFRVGRPLPKPQK